MAEKRREETKREVGVWEKRMKIRVGGRVGMKEFPTCEAQ